MSIISDVACTVCGCVCDDLRITTDGKQLLQIEGACSLAEPWFLAQSSTVRPTAEIQGTAVSLDSAITKTSELLKRSRAALIYGLSRSSTAGQRAAIRLADLLAATIDTTASLCHSPSIMAMQSVGESTCTLGEIRNRADLVLFWGCNPAETHPRHAERYSVFPTGQFVPGGRDGRTVVMIGDKRHVDDWRLDGQGAQADMVVRLEPAADFEAITSLRGLLKGVVPPANSLDCRAHGADLRQLADLAQRMLSCRCGVVFFGLGIAGTTIDATSGRHNLGHANVEVLLRLVTELNAFTRFHARRMRLYGDVSGADNVLCWQTGFPFSVNFARGYPRYNPNEYSADAVLSRGEVDVCLIIGSETLSQFSTRAREHLRRIPSVMLDYPATEGPFEPTVRITTSPYGLCSPGTAYRMDDVPIPLRSVLPARFPTDAEVLKRVLKEVRG